MQNVLATLLLAAALVSPAVAAESYTIDPRHTYPSFEINHFGFSTQRGYFEKSRGKVTLDQAAKTGSIELTVDTASLHLGFPEWSKLITSSEGFFNAEKFPTMSFKSDKLIFEGDKLIAAEGDFTLLGVTKPLRLTVANFRCAPLPMNKKVICGAEVTATIKRSEFGMIKYLPSVGDEVKILSSVEAIRD